MKGFQATPGAQMSGKSMTFWRRLPGEVLSTTQREGTAAEKVDGGITQGPGGGVRELRMLSGEPLTLKRMVHVVQARWREGVSGREKANKWAEGETCSFCET